MQEADGFSELLEALLKPAALAEAAVLALCLVLAWAIVWQIRRHVERPTISLGRKGFDGALFPLLGLVFILMGREAMRHEHHPIALFKVAVPLIASLCLIRISALVLRAAFPNSDAMRVAERTLSWVIWLGSALWITNLLPLLLRALEDISWKVGGTDISLRNMVDGAISATVVMVIAVWLSSALESRLLAVTRFSVSARKMTANGLRAVFLVVGLLLAMSAAGIPIAALSVLGGAIGVGIGLGLQKLAANYVSGFVILAERSLRIGDVVRIDNFEGRISDIKARYTVLRAGNGRESLVPNEMMITQRVENCHFADPNVALSTLVHVGYGTDLGALMPRLEQVMRGVPRVLADPGPSVQLSNFAADGLELTLVFWIGDIENGQGNVRSEINLAVWRAITEAGVEIPFPQRVVRSV